MGVSPWGLSNCHENHGEIIDEYRIHVRFLMFSDCMGGHRNVIIGDDHNPWTGNSHWLVTRSECQLSRVSHKDHLETPDPENGRFFIYFGGFFVRGIFPMVGLVSDWWISMWWHIPCHFLYQPSKIWGTQFWSISIHLHDFKGSQRHTWIVVPDFHL